MAVSTGRPQRLVEVGPLEVLRLTQQAACQLGATQATAADLVEHMEHAGVLLALEHQRGQVGPHQDHVERIVDRIDHGHGVGFLRLLDRLAPLALQQHGQPGTHVRQRGALLGIEQARAIKSQAQRGGGAARAATGQGDGTQAGVAAAFACARAFHRERRAERLGRHLAGQDACLAARARRWRQLPAIAALPARPVRRYQQADLRVPLQTYVLQ